MNRRFDYDVIVIGAGHAGIEACLAASRMGLSVLMVTTNLDRIGYMSCNPSIGGLAKGHMVREIDILGGEMARAADDTCIQFKRLNSRKGPAVRGSRAQCDKDLYSAFMKNSLSGAANLVLLQSEVKSLILETRVCKGVVLEDGSEIRAKAVIVTTGTFMNGVMHVGTQQTSGGRVGDRASIGLSDQLAEHGFQVKRLKTGTPPRLLNSSIDWSKTTAQYGDEDFYPFSLRSPRSFKLPQVACYLSYTSEVTHDVIRKNLHQSPLFCGQIEGVGPRYCPSIEDKITRFKDKDRHQTFLEPEGLSSNLIYLQGISTSLPESVQLEFLKTVAGLENVKVVRYGYAVEYDYIEPDQIFHRLETKQIAGLFLAGQINGTSGYEEAAAQGFVAGVNAAHMVLGRDPLILGRDESYIGVMIDDLVLKGTKEPYRMFTSRAEHRLVLREDNTLDRLFSRSQGLGLLSSEVLDTFAGVKNRRENYLSALRSTKVYPTQAMQEALAKIPTPVLQKSITFEELMRRPEIDSLAIKGLGFDVKLDPNVCEPVEIEVKYAGYVKRQLEVIQQLKKLDDFRIPPDMEFDLIKGLSREEVEKLNKIRPETLGQAQRISGVNPSAIQAIMVFLKSRERGRENFVGGNSLTSSPLAN